MTDSQDQPQPVPPPQPAADLTSPELPPPDPESGRRPSRPGYLGVPLTRVRTPEIIGGVLWAIGVSVVGLLLLSLVDSSVADPDIENSDALNLGIQAFAVLGFLSAAIGMTMIANRCGLSAGLRRLGALGRGQRVAATFGVALAVYVVAAAIIAGLLQPQQEDLAENLGADKDAALAITVAAGFLIVAGAAIGEELFFRGLLFGGLRQSMGLWPAAVISAVLFGLPHLPQGDLAVVAQLSLFGAVLAWAYERSGTLWVPIALHGLNNSLAFYLLVTDKI